MAASTQQRETILGALEQLLAWPEIARSPQLGKFLDYIVRLKLDGDEQSIKAYSIAVDVLGRPADFDPQSDPIVRVQARRLRTLIDEYYRGPGKDDLVRIALPVGRYVPEFCMAEGSADADVTASKVNQMATQPEPAPARARATGGVYLSWFALAAISLGALVMSVAIFGPFPGRTSISTGGLQRPSVRVVEFQNLTRPDSDAPKVAGLAIELVTDLGHFEDIDARYGGGSDLSIAIADDDVSDYVLTGIVRKDQALVQYSAILTDSGTGTVVWNHAIAVPAAAATQPDVLDEVSRRLSLILGSPRGPLHVKARELLALAPPDTGASSPYLCRMLFHLYRETGTTAAATLTADCIASLPESERASAAGLAISASLLVEQAIGRSEEPMSQAERWRAAEASLDQAIVLSPVSAFVWEQYGRLRQEMGQFDTARIGYDSAVQLNSANADALASYARLLAFGGDTARAESMARDAVDGTPDPPDWYFGVPAMLALRSGDNAQAIEDAERYARADPELGPILAILAGQRSGDGTVVNRYLPQVLDVASFRAQGVLPRLRERVQDPVLLEQIRGALVAAGAPEQALSAAF